jgi:hypothetical protein
VVVGGEENRVLKPLGAVVGGQGNVADGEESFIGGGSQNYTAARGSVVSGGTGNVSQDSYSTVSGGIGNNSLGQISTIAGGGMNQTLGFSGTIGGGLMNEVTGDLAVVGGGADNIASNSYSTVGGGAGNRASGSSGTVGGGSDNVASNSYSTVGGGAGNRATGLHGTVPGGYANTAAGVGSFAAGNRAQANHNGSLLLADGLDKDFVSVANNEFAVRATGGFRFVSASYNSSFVNGVRLAPGSGSWSTLSDRNAKENVVPVDPREVLDRVAALPMNTWNYRSQDASVRHLGPMAQDFAATFGIGENDTTISSVDADGVALAAIQGLNSVVREKEIEIQSLKDRLANLEALVQQLMNPSGNAQSLK